MDAELMRRIEAVRMPLDLAAKDNFAGVRKIAGLGIALRAACDGLIAKEPANEALVAWRERLAGWEQLSEDQQAVEVARGMRLMARYPQRQRAVVKTGPSIASMLPPLAPASAPEARNSPTPTPSRAKTIAAPEPGPAKTIAAKTARKPKIDEAIDPLAQPTHTLPGIGPAFAERLAEKGLETVEDLLWCLPRRYDDVRDAKQLGDVAVMEEGERATFVARVSSSRMIFVRRRRWAEVRLSDLALRANAVVRWFNVWAGIEKRMPAGSTVTISGVVRKREGRLEFANPDILAIDIAVDAEGAAQIELGAIKAPKPLPKLIARYPDVAGVPASKLRAACQTACARVGASADDGVPASVEKAAGLPALSATLAMLHAPPDDISPEELAALNRHASIWQKRLVFGELFALGVAVALKRRERRADAAMPCARATSVDKVVRKALPFTPTGAQTRAIGEIGDDLAQRAPMNRLLQGDVGSGKTAVAFAAAVQVARAGRQTAVMAPTEILAEQHHETWKAWAAIAGLKIALLTASTPKAVRQSLLALLAQQQIDVVIGTHALLADGVGFGALGLVVIDEQHRFGVAQRAKLRDKGDGQGAPHLLVMTATPIPRTLALTAYGDLDVSVLDELPPGRKPVTTTLVAGKRGETRAYKLIEERVAAKERAYVVCPKVEDDNEDSDWKDATTVASELAAALPRVRVGLVHGRLDVDARDRVMRAFKQGELDVLVATTVIEVGVDVPAATVMVIHDADRFGLAQLHQLRGRVGRGGGVAHCVLITHGGLAEEGRERLDAMVRTTDGFEIAETDLALRGPGELCGPRQAGVPRLRYGDLGEHFELLLEARRHATTILDEDPDLVRPEHTSLRAALARRLAQSVYGAESG
ncbi:MAG TPA: ATP-dependent DNA helicase RecG [Kofleriaceae bacterium]|nr:ATP-dependent DNA helicase RecG [Kofleriaceae bacterium]